MPLKWYDNRMKHELDQAKGELLDLTARRLLEHAKRNIEANDQVDTGFLRQSGYVITPVSNTFDDTPPGADLVSSKTGRIVSRDAVAAPPGVEEGGAIVGFAADYAIEPELENSYLYRALDQVASEGL